MRIPLLLISFCLLAACAQRKAAVVPVTYENLYDVAAARAALGDPREGGWEKKLNQAVERYRVHKLYDLAADSIKSVICHVASPRAYFELGTALLMGQHPQEAVQALSVAEQLQYAPLYNVLYELSAAYARLHNGSELDVHNDSMANHYMQVALQMGFPSPEKFKQDPSFGFIRADYDFRQAFKSAMDGRRDRAAALWTDFLGGFKPVPLPMGIDSSYFNAHPHNFDNDIDFSYEKFITEIHNYQFDRGSEPGFFYVGRVHADSNFIALIYGGSEDWGDYSYADTSENHPILSPVFFYLTTYTPKGKIIDKMLVAGRNTAEDSLKSFSMAPTLEFVVSDTAKQNFRIDPNGKFQRVSPLAAL